MNKRQKKKRDKKIAWDVDYKAYLEQIKQNKEIDYNGEGYRDPTASAVLRKLIRKGY